MSSEIVYFSSHLENDWLSTRSFPSAADEYEKWTE